MIRRDFLKLGLVAGAAGLSPTRLRAQQNKMLEFLCSPDGLPPDLLTRPSPKSTPFVAPLFIPPVKQPLSYPLSPPPDPRAHQRYEEFVPRKFYEIREQEFRWRYHPEPPYDKGSWAWGLDGTTPGPTYHARYGEPILVRMINELPPVGNAKVGFAMPKTTTHLHNAHTASESDGFPMDFISSGEFWDHHYANFPSGNDPREKLTTLWYHDHMMDFTAPNVYAGLVGFYLLFDDQDSGNENDPNPLAFRLPSGKYDVPLVLHDVLFDQDGQAVFNKLNTDGMLGDKYTINRTIQPYFPVARRKYRFRILNGGPSRFYQLFLSSGASRDKLHPFIVITGDGNFMPRPVCAESIYLSVAQRVDTIIDFSSFKPGDQVFLQNRLEQTNGRGPSSRILEPGADMMRFDVIEAKAPDKSRVPDQLRDLPPVDMNEVKRRRVWAFDYRGGMWTVNGAPADPEMVRVDAAIDKDTAEIWTIRNEGKNWSHPIHSHFTEFLLLEVNGRKIKATEVQTAEPGDPRRNTYRDLAKPVERTAHPTTDFVCTSEPIRVFMGGNRRDITTLLPNDEIQIFMRWHDFQGRYVMHCHNVVHEDHAMMIRWDIVPKGKGKGPGDSAPPLVPKRRMQHPG
jgi:FtsP/CotA-like multicopper oxidase with cupredoxin domain